MPLTTNFNKNTTSHAGYKQASNNSAQMKQTPPEDRVTHNAAVATDNGDQANRQSASPFGEQVIDNQMLRKAFEATEAKAAAKSVNQGFDDEPIADLIRDQFPQNSHYRKLSTIGQLRLQQAADHINFVSEKLELPPKPSLSNFNYGSLEEFEQANKKYITAACGVQNTANAIYAKFFEDLAQLKAQEGFDFKNIRNRPESASKLRQIVNSLGVHTFYPELDQAIDFVMKAGRFISETVEGDPLEEWATNPSFAGRSGPNCYGHVTGPGCKGRAESTPGAYAGRSVGVDSKGNYKLNEVISGLLKDGLSLTPTKDGYPVYLVLHETDYHFYRQDDDGTWSHKPGGMRKKRTDNSGRLITNPMSLDLHNRSYYQPVCFLWVPPQFNIEDISSRHLKGIKEE